MPVQTLKRLLRKNRTIYNFSRSIYAELRHHRRLKYLMYGTKAEEEWWANYNWNVSEQKDYLTLYQPVPHRLFLLNIIIPHAPQRILEIGCAYGANLYLLAKLYPSTEIVGVDINPSTVEKGNWLFKNAGVNNVKLMHKTLEQLRDFEDASFDLVFTDAVLIYVGPDKITRFANEMVRLSNKVILIKEYHLFNNNNTAGIYSNGKWIRNYSALLKQLTPLQTRLQVHKFPQWLWNDKVWTQYGAVTECIIYSSKKQ